MSKRPQKIRILFAEDDRSLNAVLDETLTDSGYDVISAFNGVEALAALKKTDVQLVLLDVKMPLMDGFEVLKHVKQHYPDIKVIMLTAYTDLTTSIKSKRLGADSFIGKPYDLDDLLCTIRRVLSN